MSRATPLLLKCHHGSLTHGTARRLLLACLPLQVDDLRAIGMLYADEVETVDTSYAKSKHKLLTIQLSYANLPVDLRLITASSSCSASRATPQSPAGGKPAYSPA